MNNMFNKILSFLLASLMLFVTAQSALMSSATSNNSFNDSISLNSDCYTMTFIVNGQAYDSFSLEAGKGVVEPKEPELPGHYFVGWTTDSSFRVITGLPETVPAVNTTFYAVFEVCTYTLGYYVIAPITNEPVLVRELNVIYGDTVNLLLTSYNPPEGYTLINDAYGDKELTMPLKNGMTMPAYDLNIYYGLSANTYDAVFDANGGAFSDGEDMIVLPFDYDTDIIAPEDPVRPGFTFLGWSPDIGIMDSEGKEFIAGWEKTIFNVTYMVDNQVYESFDINWGDELDVPSEPSKIGYDFIGWADSDGDVIQLPSIMPEMDLVFTAKFNPKSYDIFFDANGGYFENNVDLTSKTVKVSFDSEIVAPDAPKKQGYVFGGWSRDDINVGTNLGTLNSVENIVFSAQWIPSDDTVYTVEYYIMDTAGEYQLNSEKANGTTGNAVILTPETELGFTLNEKKSVLSGEISADGSLVLKVYYDRNIYTLIVNDGTKISENKYYFDEPIVIPETPEKFGYRFVEWDIDVPDSMPSSDLDVNAIFEANIYNAVFMDGDSVFETVGVAFNEQILAPENAPTKEGFAFLGWSVDGLTVITELGTMDKTEKVFYAVWEKVEPEHIHTPKEVVSEATCSKEGEKYTVCGECNVIISEITVLPATSHTAGEWIIISEPTVESLGKKVKLCTVCGETVAEDVISKLSFVSIKSPTVLTINYGDSLILNAEIANIPDDSIIIWEINNTNFKIVEILEDGLKCKVTPSSNGNSTVTITVTDSEGNVIGSATQEITSKAGFFQKLIAFFKGLFGLNKTIIQLF